MCLNTDTTTTSPVDRYEWAPLIPEKRINVSEYVRIKEATKHDVRYKFETTE